MLKTLLKRNPAHCEYTAQSSYSAVPFFFSKFCHICESFAHHLSVLRSLSQFLVTEGSSPSASTPASPQTKTASEGELSTTAAELLQDYMTTVWVSLHSFLCPILFVRIRILKAMLIRNCNHSCFYFLISPLPF